MMTTTKSFPRQLALSTTCTSRRVLLLLFLIQILFRSQSDLRVLGFVHRETKTTGALTIRSKSGSGTNAWIINDNCHQKRDHEFLSQSSSSLRLTTVDLSQVQQLVGLESSLESSLSSSLSSLSSSSSLLSASAVAAVFDPLLIQHISVGGILAFTGDVIAQTLLSDDNNKEDESGSFSFPPSDWDKIRTAAFVAFGALYTGGAQHFIFNYLNAQFDEPLTRLFLAQFGFIPLCYYPTFLLMVPALRAGLEYGFNTEEASKYQRELVVDVASKIPTTLIRNWFFWLPVQYVQFNYVPTDLQVTYAAAFGVIWNAILSWSTASSISTTAPEESTTVESVTATSSSLLKKEPIKIEFKEKQKV